MTSVVLIVVALIGAAGAIGAAWLVVRKSNRAKPDFDHAHPGIDPSKCPYMVQVGAEYLTCDRDRYHPASHRCPYGESLIIWDGDLPESFSRVIAPL